MTFKSNLCVYMYIGSPLPQPLAGKAVVVKHVCIDFMWRERRRRGRRMGVRENWKLVNFFCLAKRKKSKKKREQNWGKHRTRLWLLTNTWTHLITSHHTSRYIAHHIMSQLIVSDRKRGKMHITMIPSRLVYFQFNFRMTENIRQKVMQNKQNTYISRKKKKKKTKRKSETRIRCTSTTDILYI